MQFITVSSDRSMNCILLTEGRAFRCESIGFYVIICYKLKAGVRSNLLLAMDILLITFYVVNWFSSLSRLGKSLRRRRKIIASLVKCKLIKHL